MHETRSAIHRGRCCFLIESLNPYGKAFDSFAFFASYLQEVVTILPAIPAVIYKIVAPRLAGYEEGVATFADGMLHLWLKADL
jgi:hypothetical protein